MNRCLAIAIIVLLAYSPLYALNYKKEREIAEGFIDLLETNDLIIHDRELTLPLQMLTDRLSDHIDNPLYSFNVHLVKDRSVNAFAIPDGHIFINLGTLLFIKDLDELSAVIGHEMGHCQMRHIPENYETHKKITLVSILGIIAGTVLSAKNPEVGTALVISSLGGTENIKLQYSRRHEFEADEFGRDIMTDSSMDPSGMIRFLLRLHTYSGTTDIPDYLLTHPYTQDRISTLQVNPSEPRPDERYWTLYASTIALRLPEAEALSRVKLIPKPYKSLAVGILNIRLGKNKEALKILEGIDIPLANAYRGLCLFMIGEKDRAYPLLKDYAISAEPRIALAEILDERGEHHKAIAAIEPFQKYNIRVEYMLGIMYDKADKKPLSYTSFARYFYKTGKDKSSMYYIEQALTLRDELDRSTVEELEKMKKELKQRQEP